MTPLDWHALPWERAFEHQLQGDGPIGRQFGLARIWFKAGWHLAGSATGDVSPERELVLDALRDLPDDEMSGLVEEMADRASLYDARWRKYKEYATKGVQP